MNSRPPLAASEEDVPLEQLAATAQLLAEQLVEAAQHAVPQQRRPRLHLVDPNDPPPTSGEARLAQLTRCFLKARRVREGLFPEDLFSDPAWDMLLDLFACRLEKKSVGVSHACNAAIVPSTTALRCLNRLEQCGLVERRPDPVDCRRIYVELTDLAAWRVEVWLKTTFQAQAAH